MTMTMAVRRIESGENGIAIVIVTVTATAGHISPVAVGASSLLSFDRPPGPLRICVMTTISFSGTDVYCAMCWRMKMRMKPLRFTVECSTLDVRFDLFVREQ